MVEGMRSSREAEWFIQRGAQLLVVETTLELRHRRLRPRRPLSDFAQEDAEMDATWRYVYPFDYWVPESRNELGTTHRSRSVDFQERTCGAYAG